MLNYKYPKLFNWLTYQDAGGGFTKVADNQFDVKHIIRSDVVEFAKHLDGYTDPYTIEGYTEDQVNEYMERLEELPLVRSTRILRCEFFGVYITLWTPKNNGNRTACAFINKFLLAAFLPIFLIGFYTYINMSPCIIFSSGWTVAAIGNLIGILLGLSINDLGRALACAAYGGEVFEIRLQLELLIPGIYSFYKCDAIKDPLKMAQASAAGMEANVLLAGICYLIGLFPCMSIFSYIGAMNIMTAIILMFFTCGTDGAQVMTALGVPITDSLKDLKKAVKRLFSKEKEEKTCRKPTDPYRLSIIAGVCITGLAYIAFVIGGYIWVLLL